MEIPAKKHKNEQIWNKDEVNHLQIINKIFEGEDTKL